MAGNAIERDAREYGQHVRSGGARLGLLVARSVEPDRKGPFTARKISAKEFARESGTTAPTVMKHYRAWEAYAAANGYSLATDLRPGQEIEFKDDSRFPVERQWQTFYHQQVADSLGEKPGVREAAEASGVGAGKALEIARNPKAMQAAIRGNPEVAAAAAAALPPAAVAAAARQPAAASAVARDRDANRAVSKQQIKHTREKVERAKLTRTPALENLDSERAWMDTIAHGRESVSRARAFVRGLNDYLPLADEYRRAQVEEILLNLSAAVDFVGSALAGERTMDEELDRMAGGE